MIRALVVFALTLSAASPPLTISQVVEDALRNYPSIQVSQEQLNAAAASIRLPRTAYLPRVDMIAQANRATRNNLFGLLLPQSVIPSISGPVLGTNNLGTAWGSAVGALVTWEPFVSGCDGGTRLSRWPRVRNLRRPLREPGSM
jgi:outer membrane protein